VPHLLQEFDVNERQLRLDLDALVTQLLAQRLLISADDPVLIVLLADYAGVH